MPLRDIRPWVVLALVGGTASLGFAQPPVPTPPPKPAQPPLSSAEEANAVLAETVGLLAGLKLYQTYLNIGLLGDARAAGLYEASELTQLLGSVVEPLEKLDKQFEKFGKLNLPADDAAAIARLRKVILLLRAQGKSLQAFWDTGGEEHGKNYETARQSAWKELNDLLGLDKKDTIAPAPRPAGPKKP